MPSQMNWEETRSIMAEVQELFAGKEDMNTVEEIKAINKELRGIVLSRKASAQAIIRALTTEVSTKQSSVHQIPASQDAAKKQKTTLEEDREIMQGTVEGLKNDIAEAGKVLTDLQGETAEVDEKSKDVDVSIREQAPRVLHALSLYANITGIRWKYDDDENQHLIRGWVSLPGRDEVCEFCLDCSKETTFKAANSLWDLIDPPTPTTTAASS